MMNWQAPGLLLAILCFGLWLFTWQARKRRARLLATVAVEEIPDFTSAALGNERRLTIYLPPDYASRTHRCYPLLLINDGQDRDELQLHMALAQMYAGGRLRHLLAVAIDANDNRLQEYGTAASASAQGNGEAAALYSRFVVEELLPEIERRYRVCDRPEERAILGASLGGLSAFDIAWNHPGQFTLVGVFSGSFWWRAPARPVTAGKARPEEEELEPGQRIMHQVVRRSGRRGGFRAWFEAGTRDETADRDGDGVIDAIQDTRELLAELVCLGYEFGHELEYVEVKYGRHDYDTWSRVLPQFLEWAFPA